jgi:hypothetical protein
VKQRYRRAEHLLQTAEALATIGSLRAGASYPSQDLANSWFLMSMNMDRNVLWGAGVDASFADQHSWDTSDRFDCVEAKAAGSVARAMGALARPDPDTVTLFNPVHWVRRTPFELHLPKGKGLAGMTSQTLEDGARLLVRMPIGPMALASARQAPADPQPAAKSHWPGSVVTPHYEAKLDPGTGAIVSLRLKPSGREVLGGSANVVLAEAKSDVHNLPEKAKRTPLASSSQFRPQVSVTAGPLATVLDIHSGFYGGGVAILDHGVPGRELVGNTPILLLHNICDAYALSWKINDKEFSKPSLWMNAKGEQVFEYALFVHEEEWSGAGVPQMAWEYNSPVVAVPTVAVAEAGSFCETSPNVIVEAMRRVGDEIELRMVECLGQAGRASVRVSLPHAEAFRTDLVGGRRRILPDQPAYTLDLLPQEIVTLRLRTPQAAPPVEVLRSFEPVREFEPFRRELVIHGGDSLGVDAEHVGRLPQIGR